MHPTDQRTILRARVLIVEEALRALPGFLAARQLTRNWPPGKATAGKQDTDYNKSHDSSVFRIYQTRIVLSFRLLCEVPASFPDGGLGIFPIRPKHDE